MNDWFNTILGKLEELMGLGRFSKDGYLLAADILSILIAEDPDFRGKLLAALPMSPIQAGCLIEHVAYSGRALG
jgi:hypothetical protein